MIKAKGNTIDIDGQSQQSLDDSQPTFTSSSRPLSSIRNDPAHSPAPGRIEALNGLTQRARRLTRLHKTRSSYDDDHEETTDGSAAPANGIRVWYNSYTTIDWVHDAIKESSRRRRLRSLKGLRGLFINSWDRFQGWLIVAIIGMITALIAGAIVESEAVLFDLKDGYCSTGWWQAKRFCCPKEGKETDVMSMNAALPPWTSWKALYGHRASWSKQTVSPGWSAPVAGSPRWDFLAQGQQSKDHCPRWTKWSSLLSSDAGDQWWPDLIICLAVAILWASLASILTIYLTSSDLYQSEKIASPQTDSEDSLNAIVHSSATPSGPEQGIRRRSRWDEPVSESTSLLGSGSEDQLRYNSSGSRRALRFPSQNFSNLAEEVRAKHATGSRKTLYFGSGSGISEVKCILSGFVIHGYLGFWTLFTKSVGLTLSVASGLSLGKEGPFVHIASCVGNIVCRVFDKYERNESKRREILSCACAAGVAVAFGAPVGGILFSLEETTYYWSGKVMFRSFACAMIATAVLRFVDPFGTGEIVLFRVSYDKDWVWQELPIYVLLGVFGGLYGAFFTKLNVTWSKHVRAKTWMAAHPLLEVILITALTTLVSFALGGYSRMGGPELITDLFSECHEQESLDGLCISKPSEIGPLVMAVFWTMLAKGVLTTITFGIKLPAGIFIPSLAVGACFGRIVGLLVQYIQWTRPRLPFFSWCPASATSCIIPGTYSMLGAAATLSGVTRSTVSLAVIMFELTGTLTYAVPLGISILVARTIADSLQHQGIYDLVIEMSGLPYLDPTTTYTWKDVSVKDAMDTDIEVIDLDEANTVDSLQSKLTSLALGMGYTDGGFPIVMAPKSELSGTAVAGLARPGRRMVGYLAAQELHYGLIELIRQCPELNPHDTLCTFSYLPRGDGSNDEEGAMRDSVFLRSDDPKDLSRYVDRAPITITSFSPLELVQQYFVRLGVRYLAVVDSNGHLKGIISKKRWLAFLSELGHSAS